MIPNSVKIILMADRFYGTPALIALCQEFGWRYRIRMKGNLILKHLDGIISTGELIKLNQQFVTDAFLNDSGVKTNIGVIKEEGRSEPWIIAMDCNPSTNKVLDYGMR
jgi:hypothetical protein